MFVRCSNSSSDILRGGTPKHTQTVIDATQKETAIDQQQHSLRPDERRGYNPTATKNTWNMTFQLWCQHEDRTWRPPLKIFPQVIRLMYFRTTFSSVNSLLCTYEVCGLWCEVLTDVIITFLDVTACSLSGTKVSHALSEHLCSEVWSIVFPLNICMYVPNYMSSPDVL